MKEFILNEQNRKVLIQVISSGKFDQFKFSDINQVLEMLMKLKENNIKNDEEIKEEEVS